MSSSALNALNRHRIQTFQPFIQTHVKNIYSCIALSALAASIGGFAHLFTGLGGFYNIVAGMHILVELMDFPDNGENTKIRLMYLLQFAFLYGLGSGPLLDEVIANEPGTITTAFLGASMIFACLTLSSMFSNERLCAFHGCTFLYLLSSVFFKNFPNFLKGSTYHKFKAKIFIGLAITSSHFICDTQMFISARRSGDNDYILHSAVLFLHFITIFQCLLVILIDHGKQQKPNNIIVNSYE